MVLGLTVSETKFKGRYPMWVWTPFVAMPGIFGAHHLLKAHPRTKIWAQVGIASWLFFSAQHYSHKALIYEKTSGMQAQDGQICPGVLPDEHHPLGRPQM